MASQDYYSLLGIDRHAPDREVKRAYYNLARELHPDKAKSPDEARANAERLAVISKAYNTLKDTQRRAEYDRSIGVKPRSAEEPATDRTAAPAAAGAPPLGGGGGGAAPATGQPQAARAGISSRDLATQRVLTAQKAFVKGMEFFKVADYKKALPFFEVAVTNDPESEAQYHLRLAQCLTKTRGSFTRAVTAAEKACQLDTYNVEYKLGLGEVYETVGIASKAVEVYEDVLRWEPENDRAKLRLKLLRGETQKTTGKGLLAKIFPSIFGKD